MLGNEADLYIFPLEYEYVESCMVPVCLLMCISPSNILCNVLYLIHNTHQQLVNRVSE